MFETIETIILILQDFSLDLIFFDLRTQLKGHNALDFDRSGWLPRKIKMPAYFSVINVILLTLSLMMDDLWKCCAHGWEIDFQRGDKDPGWVWRGEEEMKDKLSWNHFLFAKWAFITERHEIIQKTTREKFRAKWSLKMNYTNFRYFVFHMMRNVRARM